MFGKYILAGALFAGLASSAVAQQTTQQSVIGPSGDLVYSDQILGVDGETYNCRPGLIPRDGQLVRRCRRVVGGANGQLLGGTLSAPAVLAAAAVLVVVAAGSSSSTTTNN